MKTKNCFFEDYSVFEADMKSEFIKKITDWMNSFQLDGLSLENKRKLLLVDGEILINDRKIISLDLKELAGLYLEIKEDIVKGAYDQD